MHIPPLYKKKSWQRFLAGVLLGVIGGYAFFLFLHGLQQENFTEEHIKLSSDLNEMEEKYERLLNNPEEREDSEPLKVRDLSITYTNAKKLEVDLLTQHQLTIMVKDLLSSVPGHSLNSAAEQVDLMISTVESKNYMVDQLTYQLKVQRLIVSEVVSLHLEIILDP